MAKKLGKGLSTIFGEDIDSVLDDISKGESDIKGSQTTIKIKDVRPNPYQPRKVFNEEALKELSESIKEHGVFTPILVRKSVTGYELVAGERRWRASKLAGLKEIPATIVEFDDKQMMEISILENIQREDLNIVEEAKAYQQLQEKLNYTQEELSKRIGKSRAHVTNVLRILKLPNEVILLLTDGKINFGHARALITMEDEEAQIELANRAAKEGLSVREVEKLSKGTKKPSKPVVKEADPYLEDVRRTIESKLNTSVSLDKKHIVIDYNGTEDLNRILEAINCLEGE